MITKRVKKKRVVRVPGGLVRRVAKARRITSPAALPLIAAELAGAPAPVTPPKKKKKKRGFGGFLKKIGKAAKGGVKLVSRVAPIALPFAAGPIGGLASAAVGRVAGAAGTRVLSRVAPQSSGGVAGWVSRTWRRNKNTRAAIGSALAGLGAPETGEALTEETPEGAFAAVTGQGPSPVAVTPLPPNSSPGVAGSAGLIAALAAVAIVGYVVINKKGA